MKLSLRALIPVLITAILLFGCTDTSADSGGNIKALTWSFTKAEIEMQAGDMKSGYILADVQNRDDFTPGDVSFISEDESVATITYSRAALSVYLYFDIAAVGAGKTSVYAVSSSGEAVSEKIEITVTDEESIESTQAETPATETPETISVQTEADATVLPETDPIPVTAARETDPPPKVSVDPITPPVGDQLTYVLNTSTKKIHKSTCSSVKRIKSENYATTTDYDKAIAEGYVQCKNCG